MIYLTFKHSRQGGINAIELTEDGIEEAQNLADLRKLSDEEIVLAFLQEQIKMKEAA
jgi:hypothetical protein